MSKDFMIRPSGIDIRVICAVSNQVSLQNKSMLKLEEAGRDGEKR